MPHWHIVILERKIVIDLIYFSFILLFQLFFFRKSPLHFSGLIRQSALTVFPDPPVYPSVCVCDLATHDATQSVSEATGQWYRHVTRAQWCTGLLYICSDVTQVEET